MKILVTGGAGFIGSHITEMYLEAGHELVVIDNLSVGKRDWVPDGVTFYNADITDRDRIEKIFDKESFDIVNHHAAHNDSMTSLDNPVKDAKVNIIGSINILEAAKNTDVEKIIYASSGGLSYGEPEELPTDEDHAMHPSYPYGISKHSFEHYLELYNELYGLRFTVLRYASVYGPRPTGGVIKNFLEAAGSGEKPVIFGDGTQTRDFIHVHDVARANKASLTKGEGFYNIGTCTETSINELWNLIKEVTGCEHEPIHKERWTGDIDRCRLDPSKANDDLEWDSEIDLKTGISNTWAWIK